MQRGEKKYPRNRNIKLSKYMQYRRPGYSQKERNDVEIMGFDMNIYDPLTLHICVLDWYPFYLNQPSESRLANTIL